jgi:S1-C subfamily serine protease
MGRLERIVVLLLLGAVASHLFDAFFDQAPAPRRPPIGAPVEPPARQQPRGDASPPARPGEVLPPASTFDPVFGVNFERRRGSTTGTAFAIDGTGLWATALHVVHECPRIALRSPRGWTEARLVWTHGAADLAVLRGMPGSEALTMARAPLRRNQPGYAIGFPQGRPGAVHGRVIGRSQMQAEGRFRGRAPTVSWAELGRVPGFEGLMGGISGGPLLDSAGDVIGVIVAESPRRGRFETLAPELLDSLAEAGARLRRPPTNGGAPPVVDPSTLERVADELRAGRRVVQAACATR